MNARDVMTVDVVSVGPGHGIRHAIELMLAYNVSGLPVMDDSGNLVGILTEGDLLRHAELGGGYPLTGEAAETAHDYARAASWMVSDVMSVRPVTVDEHTPVTRIAYLMQKYGIKRVPVMRGDRVVGLVSRADLMLAILEAAPDDAGWSDDAIRRAIETRIRVATGLAPDAIRVTVRDRQVTLEGTVEHADQREAARVAAMSLANVRSVANEIVVKARAETETETDRD